MRRLLRLLLLGGVLAGLWVLLRELLDREPRPLQSIGGVAESVEGAAKSAAGSAKAAGEAIREQASSVSTGRSNGLGDLTKAQLYEEAQRLDVEGRSKMSKDELAKAVAEARRSR